jgi:alkylhydroperoxidase family enzyme
VTDDELAALPHYGDSELFSELDKLALDLAVAMTKTPAEVPAGLRDALLEHLSMGQLTELASTIAWENHRARLNRALGVRAAGFSDGAFCALPEHGLDVSPIADIVPEGGSQRTTG